MIILHFSLIGKRFHGIIIMFSYVMKPQFMTYILFLYSSRILSAIKAMNSEFVGLPFPV